MALDMDFVVTHSADLVDSARDALVEAREANRAVTMTRIRLSVEDFALVTRIKQREKARGVAVTLIGLYVELDRSLASGHFIVSGEPAATEIVG